jgi:hypothetical protein
MHSLCVDKLKTTAVSASRRRLSVSDLGTLIISWGLMTFSDLDATTRHRNLYHDRPLDHKNVHPEEILYTPS